MDSRKPRIVILGAGPTGLEAALYARQLDYPVKVIESSAQVAANVRRWGFVRLFTPWHRNASELGLAALKAFRSKQTEKVLQQPDLRKTG